MIDLIEKQKDRLEDIEKTISNIEKHLTLLINVEQASLAIQDNTSTDGLTGIIDIQNMPLEKFKKELDQVKILGSSFQIFSIELEKQKDYIKFFTLESHSVDEKGFVQWTMHWWERSTPEGGYERGEHSYGQQDVLAQAGLTDAAFEWVTDDSKPHPTRLERALVKFNALLGLYVSALNYKPVDLPFEPPDGIMAALKERLTASENSI